jgi:MFS family permease
LLSASGIAATIGLLVGGLLVDSWGWRYIFAFSGSFALLSWLLVAVIAPRTASPQRTGRLDLVGGILFAPAMAAIVYAIGETGSASHWGVAPACLLGGAVLLVAWFVHERAHPNPLIDVRLLMSPLGASLNICTGIWAFSVLQLTQTQMIFLQQPIATGVGLGLTATMAAMVKMPAKAITMFVAPIAGQLSEVVGPRRIVFTGFVLAAIGWALLGVSHDNLWFVGTVMALFCAMAITVIYTGLNTAAVLGAPADRTSEVVGVTVVTRMIFQALGAQSVMTILDNGAKAGGGYPREGDYLIVFAMIGFMSMLGALASLKLPGRRGTPQPAARLAAG